MNRTTGSIYIGDAENTPVEVLTVNSGPIDVRNVETFCGLTLDEILAKVKEEGIGGGSGGGSEPGGGTEPGEDLPGTGTRPERPNSLLPHYRDIKVGNTITFADHEWIISHLTDAECYLTSTTLEKGAATFNNAKYNNWAYTNIGADEQKLLKKLKYSDDEYQMEYLSIIASKEQMEGGFSYFNSDDRRKILDTGHYCYWTSSVDPDNVQSYSGKYAWAVVTGNGKIESIRYEARPGSGIEDSQQGVRPTICIDMKNYPDLPDEASLVLGNTITWANESWVVAHKTTNTCYLVLAHTDGPSPWTNLQVMCNSWRDSNLSDRQKAALVEVTAGSTTGKVFVPTQAQINGGFTWFNSNEHRLASDQEYYWTSTEKDINTAICVDDTGVILDTGISKTVSHNFRPAVAIDLTLYEF